MVTQTSTVAPAGVKRKKPPTFQHLPANRAKKLKQSWVEVQKIKSKWKAQKRKEGLAVPRMPMMDEGDSKKNVPELEARLKEESEDDDVASESTEEERDSGEGDGENTGEGSHESESEDENQNDQNASLKREARSVPQRGKSLRGRGQRGGRGSSQTRPPRTEDAKPSIRELQNKAYSRSSLHTYKSNRPQVDGGRGRGRGSNRGRGQPDMRLRMNVMLEKIKRDYT